MPFVPSRCLSSHLLFGCSMLALALSATSSCSRRTVLPPPPLPPLVVQPGDSEVGIASWYGDPYHGRRAANGEIYDMNQFTAAHRTLPFETIVRVQRLDNGLEVEVRINDRGPFLKDRIVDLSRAAAEKLDLIGPGTARVRLEVVRPALANGDYAVQVGAFENAANAERVRQQLEGEASPVRILPRDGSPVLYRVVAGQFGSLGEARELATRLRRGYPQALAIRVDAPPADSFVIHP